MSPTPPIAARVYRDTMILPVDPLARALNDRLRRTGEGGRVLITNGIRALGTEMTALILRAVVKFDDFTRAK